MVEQTVLILLRWVTVVPIIHGQTYLISWLGSLVPAIDRKRYDFFTKLPIQG